LKVVRQVRLLLQKHINLLFFVKKSLQMQGFFLKYCDLLLN